MQIPDFTLQPQPTAEQLAFWLEHGCIRFRGVMTEAEIDDLVDAIDELQRAFIEQDRKTVYGTPLRWSKTPDGQPFISRVAFASMYSERIREVLSDARFTAIQAFFGEEYRLAHDEKDGVVINHWLRQPGSTYSRLGWHTDGLRDIFLGQKLEPMLNVGLYLTDSGLDKGGVRLIPGTHTQSTWQMLTGKLHFLDNRPDPREIALTARKGDLTIHDGRLWHRTAQATVEGEASRRRNLYMAWVKGPRKPRDPNGAAPLYHHLQGLVG